MSFLNKFGIGGSGASGRRGVGSRDAAHAPSNSKPRTAAVAAVASAGSPRAPEQHVATRVSNGLKEFLWNLDGLGRGTLLDLGPAWQTTLTFFIERGFRVTSDDILRDWSQFLAEEAAK